MIASFDRKFTLSVVIWFSISLSLPITDALGYTSQSFLFRLFLTGCALMLFVFFGAYPLSLMAFPVMLVISSFSYLLFPAVLERIFRSLYHLITTDENIWFFGIVAAVTLMLLLILTKAPRSLPLLFLIGVCVFVPLWYVYVDSAYAGAISYALCWFLMLSYRSGERIWSKLADESLAELRQGWLKYTYRVLILMLFVALVLPKGMAPVPWTSFQIWADETFPFLADLRGGEPHSLRGEGVEFAVSVAGYGDSARLGGPVRRDKTVLLEVEGSGGHYLRGSVKDYYSGSSWLSGGELKPWEPFPSEDVLLDYLQPVELTVNHKHLRTVTVFTLPYTLQLRGFQKELYQTEGDGVVMSAEVSRNQAYRIVGNTLAYSGDFSELESGQPGRDLAGWLKLPEGLPTRVADLARSVTEGQEGFYADMKALEGYLRSTYPYSENPSALPGNRDFVDFFLFEERTGYCTSFATALAVMARTIGIPTRYVQGFKMPEEAGPDGVYRIAGTHAHAWVEAFIPGVGWLIFEATPGYAPLDLLPPHAALPDPSDSVTTPGDSTTRPGDGVTPPHREAEQRALTRLLGLLTTILLLLSFAGVAVFAAAVLGRWLRLKRNVKQIEGLPLRMQAAAYYNMALELLAGMGLGKLPGETPREYSARINRLVYAWDLDFRKISEGINVSLYSRSGETPEWLKDQTKTYYEFVFKRYVVKVGKLTAFVELYLQSKYFTNDFFAIFVR
jgi:transglutaminase-like putative cysteine protease